MTYFSRMVESVSSAVTMDIKAEYSLRMFQVAEVLGGGDSESYAQHFMRILQAIEGEDTGGKVIQEVVEYALTYFRTSTLPETIRDAPLPVVPSFILKYWWGHCAADGADRRERSDGAHFSLNRCCISVRVQ